MENRRNYYRILHVQRDAPVEIIKTSYRTMMQRLKMHPDLGGDHWTATVINEAYATLCDPNKRAAYDRQLHVSAQSVSAQNRQANGGHQESPAEEPEHAASQSNPAAGHCSFCNTPHGLHHIDNDSECARCESPLATADYDGCDEHTRRAVARMPKSFPLSFVSQWPARRLLRGCALDLSTRGMRFQCDDYLPAGTLISLDSDVVSAVARVRSCNTAAAGVAAEYEIGIQFVTLRFCRTQGGFVSVTA